MQKLALALLAAACIATAGEAADRGPRMRTLAEPLQFRPLGGSSPQLPRLAAQAREHALASRKGIGSNAIVDESSGQTLVIAAVANTPGGFGTFFTSDLTLTNLTTEDQDIAIFYLARGQDSSASPGFRATLPGDVPPATIENVLDELGLTGVGALYIVPITDNVEPEFDPDSSIDAYTRLLTPGDEGELSQSFPAIYPDYLTVETEALALGHRQDPNFRVNAGVVNLSETAQSFSVTIFHETGFTGLTINVPPFSMNQVPIPAGDFGALSLLFFPNSDEAFEWIGYAASNDNRSGDSWSSFAGRIADPTGFGKRR